MSAVQLKAVSKSYDEVRAVAALDLAIDEGSFVTLLGPSGCGKTTTLRIVAGLEDADSGDIFVRQRRVNDVPIHRRNLGLVFQNFALFPHRTVQENVAYGLKFRGIGRAEQEARVKQALEMVRLPGHGTRLPSQLSGGQQQRVALARAIVIGPDVLLLDEPLSSLDAGLREEMRVELKTIQRELGVTTIFVTHDQGEALALSDKIVVMEHGRKIQEGPPQEVYSRPASRFVAGFLGHSNFLEGRIEANGGPLGTLTLGNGVRLAVPSPTRGETCVALRAEKILLGPGSGAADGVTRLSGRVAAVDYQGTTARYFIDVGGTRLQAIGMIDTAPLAEGADIEIGIRAADCVLLKD
jgi:putative spermidine/putrescine transport system ATP-binding protein/spermidine/putrescine transport system ATP-binding protein